MFAKNLEYFMALQTEKSDISDGGQAEMSVRFDNLRRYDLLPKGRERRAEKLTPGHIASAILGQICVAPGWAGHTALILKELRPVGGESASFLNAATLSDAIALLVSDELARKQLISLTISAAESATNSNGSAILQYNESGTFKQAFFGPKLALSLQQPGMEKTFEAIQFNTGMSRGVTFCRSYFDELAQRVELSAHLPIMGDGSEYDQEENQEARYKALGVQPSSRYLQIGVDTQVTWHSKERLIEFGQYQLVLMPKTREHTQSIHIDLQTNQLTLEQARTLANRFLSLLAWCDDSFAIPQNSWAGNPVPVPVPKRNLAFVTAHEWTFNKNIPEDERARRALGLYREGLNSEASSISSYAVLSYFKIIEIEYSDGPSVKKWIADNFALAIAGREKDPDVERFIKAASESMPEIYIYKACRLAVAHASIKTPSDADDIMEIGRLYTASFVLRLLARHFIKQELGVSDSLWGN